jgi:hypothetical protein
MICGLMLLQFVLTDTRKFCQRANNTVGQET